MPSVTTARLPQHCLYTLAYTTPSSPLLPAFSARTWTTQNIWFAVLTFVAPHCRALCQRAVDSSRSEGGVSAPFPHTLLRGKRTGKLGPLHTATRNACPPLRACQRAVAVYLPPLPVAALPDFHLPFSTPATRHSAFPTGLAPVAFTPARLGSTWGGFCCVPLRHHTPVAVVLRHAPPVGHSFLPEHRAYVSPWWHSRSSSTT